MIYKSLLLLLVVPVSAGIFTPKLTKAIKAQNYAKIEKILKKGTKLNYKDKKEGTPLTQAIKLGDRKIIDMLLKAGAKPDVENAVKLEDKTILGDLIKDDKNRGAAHYYALEEDKVELIKFVGPNAGFTDNAALSNASRLGSINAVRFYLSRGADPNHSNQNGWSPLNLAADEKHRVIAELLLKAGAKPKPAIRKLQRKIDEYADELSSDNKYIVSMYKSWITQKKDAIAMIEDLTPEAPVVHQTPVRRVANKTIHSDIDTPQYRTEEKPDNFAVVIGVENYADLPRAHFATRDAAAMKPHLIALGYPERNIVHLSDSKATKSGLQKNLEVWLPNNVTPNSTVFVYYSGHGAPNPNSGDAYLLPVDGDPSYLEVTCYPKKRLYRKLNSRKVKRVFVAVDSCFSGTGGRSVIAKGTRPLVTRVKIGEIASDRIVSWSASQAEQISGTIEEQGHGLFTYYLLKGLNGAAKIKGERITVKSLFNYLKPLVENDARRNNRHQTPTLKTEADHLIR